MRMKKRAVSTIIAELLLIVITVSIGTLVYSFASTAFGGFGAGFSNLVQDQGNKLSENLVVEQVYFFTNSTSCRSSVTECSGDLFVRNTGANTLTISEIFVTNVTANTPVHACTTSPCTPNSNLIFWAWNPTTSTYGVTLPNAASTSGLPPASSWYAYLQACTVAPCIAGIAPGQSLQIYFTTQDSVVPGTVFAFTLVSARGNLYVAYEKA